VFLFLFLFFPSGYFYSLLMYVVLYGLSLHVVQDTFPNDGTVKLN